MVNKNKGRIIGTVGTVIVGVLLYLFIRKAKASPEPQQTQTIEIIVSENGG